MDREPMARAGGCCCSWWHYWGGSWGPPNRRLTFLLRSLPPEGSVPSIGRLKYNMLGNPELVVAVGGTTGVEVRGRPIGDSLSCCLSPSHLKGVYVQVSYRCLYHIFCCILISKKKRKTKELLNLVLQVPNPGPLPYLQYPNFK